uniref:Uncharacterized protein n=1 Tax=Octopus bimaculoides TaxID=37653 RepID=A0A0L8HCG3_OCTBM
MANEVEGFTNTKKNPLVCNCVKSGMEGISNSCQQGKQTLNDGDGRARYFVGFGTQTQLFRLSDCVVIWPRLSKSIMSVIKTVIIPLSMSHLFLYLGIHYNFFLKSSEDLTAISTLLTKFEE